MNPASIAVRIFNNNSNNNSNRPGIVVVAFTHSYEN